MGQRHQIYVVRKDKDGYKALGAWHHQWKFGMGATTALYKLYNLINQNTKKGFGLDKGGWCEYYTNDVRLLDTAVKATYGIDIDNTLSRVHNETDEKYLIDANGTITPENGDNNDGCSLIVIDNIKQEVRACFFTPGHVEGQHYPENNGPTFKAWSPEKYLGFYYNKEEQQGPEFIKEFTKNIELMGPIDMKPVKTQELKRLLKTKASTLSVTEGA